MSSAIERRDEQIARLKARMGNIRASVEAEAEEIQDLAIESGVAYAFGAYSRDAQANNREIFTVAGLDPEIVWGAGAMLAGKMIGGVAGRVVTAGGRGIIVGYAYEKGRRPT